jgi:hypothetical protein
MVEVIVQLGHKTRAGSTRQTYLKEGIHGATDMLYELLHFDWVPKGSLVPDMNLSLEVIVTRPLTCVKTDRTQRYKVNGYTPRCG